MHEDSRCEGTPPHTSPSYIHTHSLLRCNLLYLMWILIFSCLFVKCLSVPSTPEVVYPSKTKFTRNMPRIQSTSTAVPFIKRDIKVANSVSKPRHSVSNTVKNFRVTLHNRKRIHGTTQRRLNQSSGSTNRETSSSERTSSAETRVILAPIDGQRVYTADKYFLVSSERVRVDVDGEANPRDSKKVSSEVLRSQGEKPKQENSGKAAISELGLEEMQRTTMHELLSLSTTSPSPSSSTVSMAKAHAALGKSPKSDKYSEVGLLSPHIAAALQLVSHDTANTRLEQSIRFPAERWQLPPSLYSARLKSLDQFQGHDHIFPQEVLNPFQANKMDNSSAPERGYEEALPSAFYYKTQDTKGEEHSHRAAVTQHHYPLPLSSVRSPTMSQLNISAEARPLGRPNVSLTGGGVQSAAKKRLRSKFASRHIDHQSKPIALPASIDDSDFDLLYPPRTRPVINTFIPLPSAGNNDSTFIAETIALPIRPAEVNSAPYVAQLNPNDKLDLCCKKQSVSSVCRGLCNFDTFTDRSLVNALLSNQCPGLQLGQAFDCATSKVDHSECCKRFKIHLHNGGQCMPFCETHLPTPPNVFSYIACLPVFENIKNCYRNHQLYHPNIYGD